MPQHIINLLDDLLQNGSSQEYKTLAAGQKATLEIIADVDARQEMYYGLLEKQMTALQKHIDNQECHTPKGILVRGNVLAWFAVSAVAMFSFLYVVAAALGIEELLKSLIP